MVVKKYMGEQVTAVLKGQKPKLKSSGSAANT